VWAGSTSLRVGVMQGTSTSRRVARPAGPGGRVLWLRSWMGSAVPRVLRATGATHAAAATVVIRPPGGGTSAGPTSEGLSVQVVASDALRSYEAFYARAAGRLVTQLFMVTGDLEEARDCVQEAFARAWLRWGALSLEGGDPFAWVHTVAYRIAVSRFRRRLAHSRALRRMIPAANVPGPTPEVVAVRDAMATLPHGQRAALVLHYFVGLPVEAVAHTLGISPSGVKSRLARGRAALVPLLREEVIR